jgi:AbrB family looped-hinge helix DNA binding protein
MAQVKVSSKYQIVIPLEVREAIGIHKGQTVSVIPMGNVIEIVPDCDISEMEGMFPDLTLDGIRDETERQI